MKKNTLLLAFTAMALSVSAQTTIPNGGFENWGNVSPGVAAEPTGWYSNKSGSTTATLGPQTAFNETANPHSGSSCLRVETINYLPPFNIKVNGNVTTGVVNAPSTDKSKGYIGTTRYQAASDIRRVPFVGRPDSLVGWFKYTSAGSSGSIAEKGKVVAILHSGHYYDPEVPVDTNAYSDVTANRIGRALFNTPTTNVTGWTRFSVPFDYASGATPEYIMISITSSDNQMTTVAGSKLWLDDLEVIYNPVTPTACDAPTDLMLTENGATMNLSWTAPATLPSEGYAYAVLATGSTPAPTDFVQTATTTVSGVTATTGTGSVPFVGGSSYSAYVISVCELATADVSSPITMTVIFTDTTLGVNQATSSQFNVFANDKQLTVDLKDVVAPNAMLSIIDLTGKEVLKVALKGNEKNTISIPASIKSGIYFYTVWGTNIQKTGKIAF